MVAHTSSPSLAPAIVVVPAARALKMKARCETDLSPGTVMLAYFGQGIARWIDCTMVDALLHGGEPLCVLLQRWKGNVVALTQGR
jgi:hypothetical protein